MTASGSHEEQPGRCEDPSVDGTEGGAGHEEGHDPGHHTQEPVPEGLEAKELELSKLIAHERQVCATLIPFFDSGMGCFRFAA